MAFLTRHILEYELDVLPVLEITLEFEDIKFQILKKDTTFLFFMHKNILESTV